MKISNHLFDIRLNGGNGCIVLFTQLFNDFIYCQTTVQGFPDKLSRWIQGEYGAVNVTDAVSHGDDEQFIVNGFGDNLFACFKNIRVVDSGHKFILDTYSWLRLIYKIILAVKGSENKNDTDSMMIINDQSYIRTGPGIASLFSSDKVNHKPFNHMGSGLLSDRGM